MSAFVKIYNTLCFFRSHYKDILWLSFAPISLLFRLRKINGQDVFEILRSLRFIILVIVIGFFAFVVVPQGRHSMEVLKHFEGNISQFICILLSLVYWSFQLYYGSRMLLKLSNIRYDENKEFRLYVYLTTMPILLAILPFFIIITGYVSAIGLNTVKDFFIVGIFFILNIIMTSLYFRHLLREDEMVLMQKPTRDALKYKIRFKLKDKAFDPSMWRWFGFLIITFLFIFAFFTFASLNNQGIIILQFIGPMAVVITGLSAWVAIAAVVAVVNIHIFRFASLLIVGLMIVSSYFNNNHTITTSNEPITPRPDVVSQFENWKKARLKDTSNLKEYPVFIVAAEGGGSRSAYWTGSLLAALCDTLPALIDHIFAISSVSGGSLGAGVFALSRRNEVVNDTSFIKLNVVQKMLGQDFLSPLSASLMFPDFAQHFIPYKIPAIDRAKALERSWECSFDRAMNYKNHYNAMNISLEKFWATDSLYQLPSLFFNCTVVNTGKRAILSNLKPNPQQFDDVISLHDTIGKAVSLSTAISLSSRFPYITPAGIVEKQNGKYWGAVVDGGYFDNSGILTALEIINIIKAHNKKTKDKVVFEPYLLIISNYTDFNDKNQYNEMLEPIMAAFNRTFGGSIGYARARMKKEVATDKIVELPLEVNSTEVPLGWYLSESSIKVMNVKTKQVVSDKYPYFKRLFEKY